MTRLAIILPTSGRATLEAALRSCETGGAGEDDVVLLMVDGAEHEEAARQAQEAADLPCAVHRIVSQERLGGIGGPLRNLALDRVEERDLADWVLYLDDDDAWAPGALQLVRERVAAEPGIPHMFRMDGPPHGLLWRSAVLQVGNVGGPMFVHPVDAERTGRWDGQRCQDHRFMVETCKRYDMQLRWHEDVIYYVRPSKGREEQAA